MLARKEQEKKGKDFPQEWLDKVRTLLNSVYLSECEKNDSSFEVFGKIYENELLLIAGLTHNTDEFMAPITCFLSVDLNAKSKMREIMDELLDQMGHFFDNYFVAEEFDDYISTWQESKGESFNFFYKITRENVALTLQANALLGEEEEED